MLYQDQTVVTRQTGMTPKVLPVLDMAVCDGVQYGWNRAHKHNPDPTPEQIRASIEEHVINSICEWFDFHE